MHKLLKYPVVLPMLLISLAVLVRIVLAIQGWVASNSDEAIMNLAALHISQGRDAPIFFYGQHYLGTLEAYVGALLFRVFVPSVLLMRVEMIAFYAAFLIILYILTRKLYTRHFALVVLALFALGSPNIFALQGVAVGYPELPLLTSLPFLVAFVLVMDTCSLSKKVTLYAAWGLFSGIAMWAHVLPGPYILMAFSLMLLWQFRDMLKIGIWAIPAGFALGAFPLLWYNIHAAHGQDTLTAVLYMTQLGQGAVYNFWQHILNTLFVSLPTIAGFSSQCFVQNLAGSYPFLPNYHLHCLAEQALWGLGFVALIIAAGAISIIGLRRYSKDREEMIKQSARLLLLLAALLTLVLYIHGGAPVYQDVDGSRYLICLWVSVPALLWPLWRFRLGLIVFALIFLVLVHGVIMTYAEIPSAQTENAHIQTLAKYLEKHRINRFYSEYWTCNRLIFYTQERLICANTDVTPSNRLVHGWDRYKPYRQMVAKTEDPAFVYPSTNITIGVVEYDLKQRGIRYTTDELAGCTIIVPRGTMRF